MISKLAAPDVVHSTDALASDKRYLRSHDYDEDDEEERAGGANAFDKAKLQKMLDNINYAYKKFAKWSTRGWSSGDVHDSVPKQLYNQYYNYRKDAGHASNLVPQLQPRHGQHYPLLLSYMREAIPQEPLGKQQIHVMVKSFFGTLITTT
ncbi:hypothetical protein PC129_g13554 [Phytophthora cactorum]|nr:hypothetical protein PC112_g15261 [Phytophthora cactorum]KAG2857708.1 hypothetical protein PC113_g10442 [Phytophthora cactorum]KAG3215567.1 hypothetical protein PC129_g13554 [Phytophthora cactorum]